MTTSSDAIPPEPTVQIIRPNSSRSPDSTITNDAGEGEPSELESASNPIVPMAPAASGTDERGFLQTDAGNAELFASLCQDFLRYDHLRKRWLIWNEHWWIEDKVGKVRVWAKRAARYRLRASGDIENDETRKQAVRWALKSESRYSIDSMLELAKSEAPLAENGEEWDADPWLFGVANGVVDLRYGVMLPGRREDNITLHTSVLFDASAECPRWLKFLDEIFEGDKSLIEFIQRAFGYCLTGVTDEQCLFFCFGEGSNGKSTLLETLRVVFGDYAGSVPFSTFEANTRSSIPSDVASTRGKRFVTAAETSESAKLNEARVKSMTGGDKVSARFMYKDWMAFESTAKIWLAFNHKPSVSDDSHGFWRRVKFIPFLHRFSESEKDRDLKGKLRNEASGILGWLLEGYLNWKSQGLGTPAIVEKATEAYRKESDSVAAFINEKCIVQAASSVPVGELRKAYEDWAKVNGEYPKLNNGSFSDRLKLRGFEQRQHGDARTRTWFGIELYRDPLAQGTALNLRTEENTNS